MEYGGLGRNRITDTRIFKRLKVFNDVPPDAIAPVRIRGELAKFRAYRNGQIYRQFGKYGAGKESRTLDLNLGKVALYQLSYSRA
jgi:hypothetical protein